MGAEGTLSWAAPWTWSAHQEVGWGLPHGLTACLSSKGTWPSRTPSWTSASSRDRVSVVVHAERNGDCPTACPRNHKERMCGRGWRVGQARACEESTVWNLVNSLVVHRVPVC